MSNQKRELKISIQGDEGGYSVIGQLFINGMAEQKEATVITSGICDSEEVNAVVDSIIFRHNASGAKSIAVRCG